MFNRTFSVPIDHIGLIGPDLESMIAQFNRLGFNTRGLTSMQSGAGDDGRPSTNAHYVFDQGYVELITSIAGDHLSAYASRYAGPHILALATNNAALARTQLAAAGFRTGDLLHATRPANHGERTGTASFDWFAFAPEDFPEALVCVVEHGTPELIFQPGRIVHENEAYAISEVFVYSEQLGEAIARYSKLSFEACAVEVNPAEKNTCCGRLTLLGAADINSRFPALAKPPSSRLLGLAIDVADHVRLEELLKKHAVPYQAISDREWLVLPEHAAGSLVLFRSREGAAA